MFLPYQKVITFASRYDRDSIKSHIKTGCRNANFALETFFDKLKKARKGKYPLGIFIAIQQKNQFLLRLTNLETIIFLPSNREESNSLQRRV